METATAIALDNVTYINGGIVERVNQYIAEEKMSIAALAKEIGYSRTAVSRFLAGKYENDSSDMEERLIAWIAEKTGEIVAPTLPRTELNKRLPFFETRDAKSIIGVCQSCQDYIGLGIVTGRSGYGKTHTLKQYAKLPCVAYIECDDTMSSRDLVEAIERVLGIPNGGGTIWRRVNGIRDFFNANKGYLLIVDEADKLVSKYTQKKMEILRGIFDQADVGIVIAGEPKLEAQLKTYLARMANRVDFYTSLHGLTASEVSRFLEGFDIDEEAMGELTARACNPQNGCFRLLDRTISNVLRILQSTQQGRVTLKIIEQASGMMML